MFSFYKWEKTKEENWTVILSGFGLELYNLGLTLEYPAALTTLYVAGYAVRGN